MKAFGTRPWCLLILVAALASTAAAPATASDIPPGVPWTCAVHATPIQVHGTVMHASGSQFCSGDPGWRLQRVVVTIEKQGFFGFWSTQDTVDSGYVNDDTVERTVFYDCKGSGQGTFRGRATGYATNGAFSNSTYNSIPLRINCG